jgi:hypothetical protein
MRYVRTDFQFGTWCHLSEMIVIGAGLVESYFANHAGHKGIKAADHNSKHGSTL